MPVARALKPEDCSTHWFPEHNITGLKLLGIANTLPLGERRIDTLHRSDFTNRMTRSLEYGAYSVSTREQTWEFEPNVTVASLLSPSLHSIQASIISRGLRCSQCGFHQA